MTGAEVLQNTREVLDETGVFHLVLDIDVSTDLVKDSLSIDVWEKPPNRLKLQVLSAINPQLRGLAFATDGDRSTSYSPHANEVVVGPAEVVRLPSIIESLIRARTEWIQSADAQRVRVVAREREDGLVVYKIVLPLARDGYAEYWIDVRQWWVRRMAYQDDFLGRGTVRMREIEGFVDLPDTQFDLEIPDGATITEFATEDSRHQGR
jgi:outer membrane lipoprotein-sorting protein